MGGDIMGGTIRFSTLASKYGPVTLAVAMGDADWDRAVAEGRYATVYHAENDLGEPADAMVGHHGFVNVMCKIAFAKPLPQNVLVVNGMRSDWGVGHFLNHDSQFTQVKRVNGVYIYSLFNITDADWDRGIRYMGV